uniref:ribosomal protein L5 n=1 Tax=Fibrocapsa japonica TaxID=94617 RepID=UPI002113972D|nr:ribosomal protein L5 [Fibrocapsa japonica]UTE95147.1 ribosomal protein L5 [Fibrocapsa japonica]
MRINLKEKYENEVVPDLIRDFNYKNLHEVPKITKIQINRGLGLSAQNSSILKSTIDEIRLISGQQPIITKSKKSIAGFKLREEQNIGVTVTLRKKKMYSFLEKLIHLTLPRIRDFRGLPLSCFDQKGNYNFGLKDQLVFPEITYESVDQTRGFNISIITTSKTKEEGLALFRKIGLPLVNN